MDFDCCKDNAKQMVFYLMKFDRILAMLAYAYQAIATLGLVFCVGYLLPSSEYGRYSLAVATAQGAAVLTFDWIRQAATRFCVSVDGLDSEARKQTVLVTFVLLSTLLVGLGILGAFFGVASVGELLIGVFVALLVGATDMQLVFLRIQGSFSKFSALQTMRASLLFIFSCLAAWYFGSSVGALAGLAFGYLLSAILFVGAAPGWWIVRPALASKELFREMAKYGLSAAAAAVIALQVPLILRWAAKLSMSADSFAGFSLSMDLLQKPFNLVTTAIAGVLTPSVIQEFDQGEGVTRTQLQRLYEAQLWAVMLVLGGAIALLPDVSEILVKPSLREGFLMTGVSVGLIFAVHTLIQTTVATPGHLLKAGTRLVLNAVVEFILVAIALVPFVISEIGAPFNWLWYVLISVVFSAIYSLPLLNAVRCPFPFTSVFIAPIVAVSISLNYLWYCGLSYILVIKMAWISILCAAGIFLYVKLKKQWG